MPFATRNTPERVGNSLARELVHASRAAGGETTRSDIVAGDPARDTLLSRFEHRGVIAPLDSAKKRYRKADLHRFNTASALIECGIALRDVDSLCAVPASNLPEVINEALIDHLYALGDSIAHLKWQMQATRTAVAQLAAIESGKSHELRPESDQNAPPEAAALIPMDAAALI